VLAQVTHRSPEAPPRPARDDDDDDDAPRAPAPRGVVGVIDRRPVAARRQMLVAPPGAVPVETADGWALVTLSNVGLNRKAVKAHLWVTH
jgi:hypothetical protein